MAATRLGARAVLGSSRQLPMLRAAPALLFSRSSLLPSTTSLRTSLRTFSSTSPASLWPFSSTTPKVAPPPTDLSSSPTPAEPLAATAATSTSPPPIEYVDPSASASASAAVTDLPSSTLSENLSDAATTHFFLPTLPPIPSGTLDLTSLAGAYGPHPIMRLQSMFLQLHESLPLLHTYTPWYILIPAVTIALRSLLFWFQVRAQRNAARMAIIQPQMLANMNRLKAAKKVGDVTGQQAMQVATQQLMKENGVNPFSSLMFPLAQAGVFMCMFFALKGLAGAELPSMMNEGFGWVQDLTKSDPYYALPILSTGLTLASLEAGLDSTTQVQTSTTKNMKAIFRGMLVISLPVIAYFPAALLVYWVTNNFISLIQALTLKQPMVRKLLNIPLTPKKAQPGEVGYVKEPTFAEAFRDMQVGAGEKWEETKQQAAEREAAAYAKTQQDAMPSTYTPRRPPTAGQAQRRILEEVTEDVVSPSSVEGEAQRIVQEVQRSAGTGMGVGMGKEEEKAQRVLKARLRRTRQQQQK